MESITNVNPTITNDTPTDVDTPTKQPPFQYAPNKPFSDISKIEIFEGNHFKRWQERVYSTLDVHGVAFILNKQKPDDGAPNINVWTYANKVSRHTILSTLSNELFDVYCPYKEARQIWESWVKKFTAEDVGQQKFAIGNYYHWQMTDEKEIKAQITEYYKLVEDHKSDNIILPDEFVADYHQFNSSNSLAKFIYSSQLLNCKFQDMADAFVSALAQTIVGNLNSVVLQEIGLAWGLSDELNNLESIFGTIQLVLQDAELKQRKSEPIQNWLRKLKNAAYDAENILDQIATEGLKRRVNSARGVHHQLKSFLSLRNPLLFRSKMAHKVKDVREKLDAIAKERLQFHLSEGVMENRFGETLDSRQTSSLVNELEICGRKEEKEMIIGELLDSRHAQDDLSVYALWGMGGLGKTTLAQLVYNDARTEKHFELRIWVCVSDDFSIQRLVRAIIESIGGVINDSELDPLQRQLQESLRGRKFLLVLDDVWNENHSLWDGLKEVLRCGSKGSMLMVTTRIEKVAIMMATITPHNIGYLSEDDSWSLFKQRAFIAREEEENLVAIGKMIVKKCGGVPLAIKALGSLMRFKSHEGEWLAIKESEIWHLRDDENCILPALRLSYDNLLPQMRQCFAYCCIFPKDHVMEENELVQLWMANGFIPSECPTDSQLTGHLIFKELVWRSFLQDVQIDSSGKMCCKMHDLMHDLAQSVLRHETYIMEYGKVPSVPKMLRHLCLDLETYSEIPKNGSKLKLPIEDSLRSLIVDGGDVLDKTKSFFPFLSKQQYLRVLVVNSYRLPKLPKLVYKLAHLRYLKMSCVDLERLPESLTYLLNLQTLKLTDCDWLLELPKSLRLMKNLWFLEMEEFPILRCTPPGLGDLTCLRTLSIFIVGQYASHQIDQLKELNLGGNLSIKGLENVRNFEDAKSANLIRKKNLISLSLSWKNDIKEESAEYFEEVLKGLQPHENLEKICINSYKGSRFPNWMSTSAFKHLNDICLKYCGRCEHLPTLGKLSSLKSLELKGMNCIKSLGTEWLGNGERSFPTLATLTISEMPNLEEWIIPDSVESFPCLKDLKIEGCPKLTQLPFLPALRSLHICRSSSALVGFITSLTSLTSFVLSELPDNLEFAAFGLQFLNSLENLNLTWCDRPLQKETDLQHLMINGCCNLKHLPESVQQLSALRELEIWDCQIYDLPNWLGSLQSLRVLRISGCTLYRNRMAKGRGLAKISHVPFIEIEWKIIQDLDSIDSDNTKVDEPKDVEDDEDGDVIPRISEAPTLQYFSPHIGKSSSSAFVRSYRDGPSSLAHARPRRDGPSSSASVPHYRGGSHSSDFGLGYRDRPSFVAHARPYRDGPSSLGFAPSYKGRPSTAKPSTFGVYRPTMSYEADPFATPMECSFIDCIFNDPLPQTLNQSSPVEHYIHISHVPFSLDMNNLTDDEVTVRPRQSTRTWQPQE
ncbi:hypothetical protein BUALT_Bualt12G0015500 [Buddleja alternifolia]|uniref:Uncharacterized protein n=1 Tax=Buddleja alternifolia TaxID=168488 RepID=A0AAV6WSQ7_9LAMI|nr:hypothetical protein BUALT_Bualt12G0015500 [Buddleja alternifolia]